jgi:hypothetical protein
VPDLPGTLGLKVATALGKGALDYLLREDYTSRAIGATDDEFGERFEGLPGHLARYAETDDYAARLARLQAGEREPVDDIAVTAFLRATDFHAGRKTKRAAAEILGAFFGHLLRALHEDKEGLSVQAARVEVLSADLGTTFQTGLATLRADIARILPAEALMRVARHKKLRWTREWTVRATSSTPVSRRRPGACSSRCVVISSR